MEAVMYNNKCNLMIYKDAYQYLLDHTDDLTPDKLDTYLECSRLEHINDAFSSVVNFAVDWYKPKRNRLLYGDHNLEIIRDTLNNADLEFTFNKFANNPERLYDILFNSLVLPQKEDRFTKKVLKIYVNVICSMSKYLSQFNDIKTMYDYFDKYQTYSEKIKLVNEIRVSSKQLNYKHDDCNNEGWGFALASNWLKDIGMQDYCKPDTHVKAFSIQLKLTESETQENVFKSFVAMADSAKTLDASVNAFKADRLAYLIGSGDFFKHNGIVKYHGSMPDFTKQELQKLLES